MKNPPRRIAHGLLASMVAISPTAKQPPSVPLLARKGLKFSGLKFSAAWAKRWLGVGEESMEKTFLPLLRICRTNHAICKSKNGDPAWKECFKVCCHNLDLMEAKWANTVEASRLMRIAAGMPPRKWPK